MIGMAMMLTANEVAAITGRSLGTVYKKGRAYGGVNDGPRSWLFASCNVAKALEVSEEWLEGMVRQIREGDG